MIGLLLKDILQLKRVIKILGLLALFYGGMAVAQGSAEMIVIFAIVMIIMIMFNTISLDEHGKWNQYALTLPYNRTELVLGKYLLVFIAAIVMTIAVMLFELGISGVGSSVVESGATVFCAGLFSASVMLPVIFKFGIDTGRYIVMLIALLPSLLMLVAKQMNLSFKLIPIQKIVEILNRAPWILIIIVAVTFLGSILLSLQIYKKKEY